MRAVRWSLVSVGAFEVLTLVAGVDHDFGGHFPGLDNPPALIGDLREIAKYWA